ncbi:MAG: HAD family hydrolase [Deltaproteobacteria bacterium]|nr:HAD family hydrolase [Deltaproteobacteria bacterium]
MIALFDLDGTVLTFDGAAPGPGRTAMGRASRELYGDDHTQGIRFAGGTDRAIARALLDRAGLPFDEDKVQALIDRYLEHLEVELARRPYRAIGDVAGTVTACTERGARVGLATGNVRRGAAIKLASAGLGDVFDLSRGGYGCDHEVRAEVVRIAIARCGREGPVVVVGDTLQDVAAARAAGAHAVGVAVNQATRDELIAAGADAIVDRCDRALVDALFRVAAWR